jgi:septal ring-binding cell division protein DamX
MADVPTSGTIDPSAFPFLLIDLHRHGATGSLKVAGPSYQKALYFRAGRILFGSSNDPRDQLGAILIESGKITPEQLEDVNGKVGPGSPLAKVLTDTGFVNQRELSEAARAKVERILSDVIAYDSGSFEFEDGVLPKGAVDLKLSTERVVVAAVRRVTDRNFVLRYIDGMEVVLRGTNDVAVPFAEIETDTSGITHYLDGVRTLKEAASLARLDDFEAAKIACALLFLGAVERVPVVDLGAVAAEAQGVAPPATPSEPIPAPPAPAPPALAPPPGPPADDTPFMIPTSEPETVIGMEGGDEPGTIRMEPAAPALQADAGESISMASADPPVMLMEPEPTVLMAPEAPAPAPEAPFVEPPIAPPIVPPPPSRRQYDVPAPEPLPVPTVTMPAPSRPSQEDLAALDQLLNPRSVGASAVLDKSVADAAARPGPRSSKSAPRAARRSTPSRAPLFLGIGAAVALAAAAGWFFVLRPRSSGADARADASATVGTPPDSVPRATIPTTLAQAVPVAPESSAAPLPSAAAPAPGGDARALLQGGRYPEAARLFAADLKAAGPRAATLQLLIACSTETVQKAVENVGAMELLIVPTRFQGRDCYRLGWGIYPTSEGATAALRTLPSYFREHGATPRVMRAAEIAP